MKHYCKGCNEKDMEIKGLKESYEKQVKEVTSKRFESKLIKSLHGEILELKLDRDGKEPLLRKKWDYIGKQLNKGAWKQIKELKTKLKERDDVVEGIFEEIDDTYKDLDMGKTIPIFIQRLKERIKKKHTK